VAREHAGEFPRTYEDLRKLPGVGDYTAGAIASIAFGAAVPAVDGNVVRVLSRFLGLEVDQKSPAGRSAVREQAARLVPAVRPGDFNQALMELGATVCAPRAPRCDACPLARACVAKRTKRTESLPLRAKRREPKTEHVRLHVIARGEAVLLAKRPKDGLMGGLWEPPRSAPRGVRGITSAGRFTHVLTHRRLEIEVVRCASSARHGVSIPGYDETRWVRAADLEDLGLSTLARKALVISGFAIGARGSPRGAGG
jgi:A/G-specific adenine glycosylase